MLLNDVYGGKARFVMLTATWKMRVVHRRQSTTSVTMTTMPTTRQGLSRMTPYPSSSSRVRRSHSLMTSPLVQTILLVLLMQPTSPAHCFSLQPANTNSILRRSSRSTSALFTTTTITIPSSITGQQLTSTQQKQYQHKVTTRQASLPNDLSAIQSCRRSAYPNKNIDTLLSAAKSFCNADQIQRPGYVCFIATTTTIKDTTTTSTNSNAAAEGGEVVLGTADYNTNTGVVNNVYVREYARKNGLAELMMQEVESYHTNSNGEKRRPLKLTVSSSNIPAISLYKKMGFEARGANGLLDGLSSAMPMFNFLMEMEK